MQDPSPGSTRTHAVQQDPDTALDALVDLACVEGWVLVGK
jgi:hypothetical protein